MTVHLRALATANPPLRLSQTEVYDFLAGRFEMTEEEGALYRRLLLDGPIRGRCFGMDAPEDALVSDPDRLNQRFLKASPTTTLPRSSTSRVRPTASQVPTSSHANVARATATEAARRALASAGIEANSLGGLIINTCTGYVCPGLTSYVAEDLGMSRRIRTLDIVGQGCGAAIPNLEAAAGWIALEPTRPVLSVAVEICSATLFMGPDPALVVSNAIFGDGAAAAVLTAENAAHPSQAKARFLGFGATLDPGQREALRYRMENGRLRNHLTQRVPVIGARLAYEALEAALCRAGVQRRNIRWWAVHGGGTAVLEEVGLRLGLSAEDLRFSTEVFCEYGNMSSPTVLFALDRILKDGRPARGDLVALLAFGAGFSAFAALLEFTG